MNQFFEGWEARIESWDDAILILNKVEERPRELAWRGVANSDHALYSSLYRKLVEPDSSPVESSLSEERLVTVERSVLAQARNEWRFSNTPALMLLAELQHYGAPTRLIDVTKNAFVGLWFAVEKHDETDGRLLAFDVSDRRIKFESEWEGIDPPWWDTNRFADWCHELRYWVPPVLNERISAQFSGFIVAGVPKLGAGHNTRYRKSSDVQGEHWKADEIRSATSVSTRLGRYDTSKNAANTFTWTVAASAKHDIRSRLAKVFGFSPSSIYPDMYGLAEFLRDRPSSEWRV